MSIDDESKRKLSDILHGIKSSDANIYINVFLQSLKCDAFAISRAEFAKHLQNCLLWTQASAPLFCKSALQRLLNRS